MTSTAPDTDIADVTADAVLAESASTADASVITGPFGASADYRGHGRANFTINFQPGKLFPTSVVVASICEVGNGTPFLGAAELTVHNVIPGTNFVLVRTEVAFSADLNVRVFLYVTN